MTTLAEATALGAQENGPAGQAGQPWLADADQLRLLLREVYAAAGGDHDDWDACPRS